MPTIELKWRKKAPEIEALHEAINHIEEKGGISVANQNKKISNKIENFVVKSVGYINNQTYRREKFERCEYNLSEIRDASEADSYIKIALSKYSYLIYKAGWRLKSENQEAIDYTMKRFRLMSYATGVPMDILFQEIADDLVRYSNAFLIKSRVDYIPNIKAVGIVDSRKPIGGYCRIDPATIKIKRDKCGNVIKYEQGKGENKKQWSPEDVIHIYMDKDANNAYGTPRIIAALDDVKLLRKIEGNVVALIHRFSMPLFQWKIGLPQQGMGATDAEIRKTKREVEGSSLDGLIITNEKTEIKSIGAEGSALNAQGYLQYFENRVFTALSVSASQMGRGGAKQDADSMEAQTHDTVKYIQRIISAFIENMMIGEILLEGGFDILDTNNAVEYVFEEISLETKIKQENHEILKFQSNVNTFEEARRHIGAKDVPDDENRLYQKMITDESSLKQIDRNGEWQEKMARINSQNKASETGSKSSTSTSKAKSRNTSGKSKPNKAVDNNNRPKNQHGTSSVKVKESVEKAIDFGVFDKSYQSAFVFNEFIREANIQCIEAMVEAIHDINNISNKYHILPTSLPIPDSLKNELKENIDTLIEDMYNSLSNNNNDTSISISEQSEKLDEIIDYYSSKFYKYSYLKTGIQEQIKFINVKKENETEYEKIELNEKTLEDLLNGDFDNCTIKY